VIFNWRVWHYFAMELVETSKRGFEMVKRCIESWKSLESHFRSLLKKDFPMGGLLGGGLGLGSL